MVSEIRQLMALFNSTNAGQTLNAKRISAVGQGNPCRRGREQSCSYSVCSWGGSWKREQRRQTMSGISQGGFHHSCPWLACGRGWTGPQRPWAALGCHPLRVVLLSWYESILPPHRFSGLEGLDFGLQAYSPLIAVCCYSFTHVMA